MPSYTSHSATDSLLLRPPPLPPPSLYLSRLEPHKRSTAHLSTRVKSLSKTVSTTKLHTLQKHQRDIWLQEWERLGALHAALDKSGRGVRAMCLLEDLEMGDGIEDGEEEDNELQIQILAFTKSPSKHPSELGHLRSLLSNLSSSLSTELTELKVPDDGVELNPWMVVDGTVVKFTDLKCSDPEVERGVLDGEYPELIGLYTESHAHLSTCLRDAHSSFSKAASSSSSSFHLKKLLEEYMFTSCHPTQKYQLCISRIKVELPSISSVEIPELMSLTHHIHSLTRHLSILKGNQVRDLEGFRGEVVERFARIERELVERGMREAEMDAQMSKVEELHRVVGEARSRKMQVLREQSVEECRRYQELQIAELEDQERQRKDQEERYEQIAAYQANKQASLLAQIQLSQSLQDAYTSTLLERSKYNSERIQHRRHKEVEKQWAVQAKKTQAMELRERVERQLEALRRTVAVEAQADWSRIWGDTVAWREFKGSERDQKALFTTPGFSTQHIMRDPRMKMSVALHEKGLSSNKYARQVLCGMVKKPVRGDQVSAIQFG